jgi:hypothetical protein
LVDSTCQIQHSFKPLVLQELNRDSASVTVVTIDNDLSAPIQLIEFFMQLAKGDKPTLDVGNFELVWFAHIEEENLLSPVKTTFQILHRNLRQMIAHASFPSSSFTDQNYCKLNSA